MSQALAVLSHSTDTLDKRETQAAMSDSEAQETPFSGVNEAVANPQQALDIESNDNLGSVSQFDPKETTNDSQATLLLNQPTLADRRTSFRRVKLGTKAAIVLVCIALLVLAFAFFWSRSRDLSMDSELSDSALIKQLKALAKRKDSTENSGDVAYAKLGLNGGAVNSCPDPLRQSSLPCRENGKFYSKLEESLPLQMLAGDRRTFRLLRDGSAVRVTRSGLYVAMPQFEIKMPHASDIMAGLVVNGKLGRLCSMYSPGELEGLVPSSGCSLSDAISLQAGDEIGIQVCANAVPVMLRTTHLVLIRLGDSGDGS